MMVMTTVMVRMMMVSMVSMKMMVGEKSACDEEDILWMIIMIMFQQTFF